MPVSNYKQFQEITLESGFLDKLHFGDCVLADRGFTIADEIALCGATLKVPKFTRGKTQLPAGDVDFSRSLANVRIHVERVIGRLRKFSYLQSKITITQIDLLDDVMTIISSIINVNRSIVTNK